jgi:hypothetical protein
LPTILFPVSATAGNAVPVPLNPGDEPRADIRLLERPRFTVRIQLKAERIPPNPRLIFIPYGGDLCAALDYGISGSRDGVFEIENVPECIVRISGMDPSMPMSPSENYSGAVPRIPLP